MKQYTEFKALKKAIRKAAEAAKADARFYIRHGYYKTWSADNREAADKDAGIRHHATEARYSAYKAGRLNRSDAIRYAIIRAEKEIDKRTAATIAKIEAAETAPAPMLIRINVEWKRNTYWGYNPTAEVYAPNGQAANMTTGHASGCGYDKRSAAVAEAFNDNLAVMRLLYNLEENRLHHRNPQSRREFIGYGSGYYEKPYFEGGVGIECFIRILEKAGYKVISNEAGKYNDFYYAEPAPRKGRKAA